MIVGTTAKYVPAGTSERKLLSNAGGGKLYYSINEAVSSGENEGELAATQSKEAVKGYWVVSASQTNLVIERSTDPAGEDFVTAAELAAEKSSRETEDGKRIVGPTEATNTDVVIFEGTTGKKAKDSAVSLATLEAKASKTEVTTEKERAETAEALKVAKASDLAATTTDVLTSKITTDTKERFVLNADGKQEWGKGENTAPDTNLYRAEPNVLKTDDAFEVGAVEGGRAYTSNQAAADTIIRNRLLAADANPAYKVSGDGKTTWGAGGASAVDTVLFRSGAAALKLEGGLITTGEANVGGDLNHDGSKVGLYGVAPATRPEVKKAALTADELAAKLATLGIVKVEA